jgi:hypothetical protein
MPRCLPCLLLASCTTSVELLATCHLANALFTPREDEALIDWATSVANKAQQSLAVIEPTSLCWTDDRALEFKTPDTSLVSSLPIEQVLRLRFSFLAIVNLLLHRCVYVADASANASVSAWSVGAMLRQCSRIVFNDTNVGRRVSRRR